MSNIKLNTKKKEKLRNLKILTVGCLYKEPKVFFPLVAVSSIIPKELEE